MSNNNLSRIVFVDEGYCRPKKCGRECKKSCPVVRMGKLCVEVTDSSKTAIISEELCIGCGICVKKCPFKAIKIINLPNHLQQKATHRYGPNSFKLHGLPVPQSGQVIGLVGPNGIGKSTALKIVAAKLKPNLGRPSEPDWPEILNHFKESRLAEHFPSMIDGSKKVVIKPQFVEHIVRVVQGNVNQILDTRDQRKMKDSIVQGLDLQYLLLRNTDEMAGGELQRFAIAATALQKADIYMFDEPSNYLDIRQRINVGKVLRELLSSETCMMVADHDLSLLDYVCDLVCCLYGSPGAYGAVTAPYGVREGINVFLEGYLPQENWRFRDTAISFKHEPELDNNNYKQEDNSSLKEFSYPELTKTLGSFKLKAMAGTVSPGEIISIMGQNGVGKTTFVRMLAGALDSDNGATVTQFSISYKPQKIAPRFQGTIRELFQSKISNAFMDPQFHEEVIKPLQLERLMNEELNFTGGGELQRIALALSLGKKADVYLLDEPSAYLDCEFRIIAARIIKRFVRRHRKIAFVVDHDFTMALYLADRVIVYEGEPCCNCYASAPLSVVCGMNKFLKTLDVTVRRDGESYRPRINQMHSVMDQQQRESGTLFIVE